MRIAVFTDTYPPNVDGVAIHIKLYKKALEDLGHEVYIFTPGSRKQKEENKDPKIHYFTSSIFKPYPDYRVALFPFASTTNLIREIKPDIIHSHGISTTGIAAFRVAKKLGIPHLATFHTKVTDAVHYISENKTIKSVVESIAWEYLRWYFNNFQKVIAPSNYAKSFLEEKGINNVVVLPSGIDLSVFNGKQPKKNLLKKLNIDKPIVLFVGRVVKEKNIDLILDTAVRMANKKEVIFLIVGKGPAEDYYKQLVESRKIDNVRFLGYLPHKSLRELYYYSDVFLFPSKFDTQGLVVLEAMAMGLPVVVPSHSAPADFVIDGKNGYLCKSDLDYVDKLILAINNKKKLSKYAIKTAKKFDLKKRVKELLKLYSSMIKHK